VRVTVRFQWAGRGLKCVSVTVHLIRDHGTQCHHGGMDEHDPVSHSHWPDVHPDPPRVHPPLDVLGVSALVDALNNPPVGNATESTVLGPFFTEDAPDGSSPPLHSSLANWSVIVSRPPAQRIQSRLESQSRRKERESTCMSRDACSLRVVSPFRAR
jgi:hypothetical protein